MKRIPLNISLTIQALNRAISDKLLSGNAESDATKYSIQQGSSVITLGVGSNQLVNNVPIITGKNERIVGLCDFDQQRTMEASKNVVANRVFFGFGTNAEADKEAEIDYTNLRSEVPAQIRNAVLVVRQKNRDIIRMRVDELCTGGDSMESMPINLEELLLVAGDVRTEAELQFPDNIAYSAGAGVHVYFQLAFIGFTTSLS